MSAAIAIVTFLLFDSCKSAKWAYIGQGNNATHWDEYYEECGYERQSPIDLRIDNALSCEEPLELDWVSENSHYVVWNDVHSLKAQPFHMNYGGDLSGLEVLHRTNDTAIRLTNSFYDTYDDEVHKEYCFNSLHFHWGTENGAGSEHTVNGEEYPLEVHLVHYACDYGVIGEALTDYASGSVAANLDDDNVLAVIGVIFEIGEANPVLDRMLDDLIIDGIYENRVDEEESDFDEHGLLQFYYTQFDVGKLLPESREMVSYLGSLTTPPCYETVRWHVLKEHMTVSEEQMERFRDMLQSTDANDTMAPNFRPVQPMYGRKLYQCAEDIEEDIVRGIESAEAESEEIHDVIIDNAGTLTLILLVFGILLGIVLVFVCVAWSQQKNQRPRRGRESTVDEKYMATEVGYI